MSKAARAASMVSMLPHLYLAEAKEVCLLGNREFRLAPHLRALLRKHEEVLGHDQNPLLREAYNNTRSAGVLVQVQRSRAPASNYTCFLPSLISASQPTKCGAPSFWLFASSTETACS